MSSALGGLSAAKRRRGTAPPTGSSPGTAPTGKQPTFINQQNELGPTLKQVSPIEMLKIHEARLCRIETMDVIAGGGSSEGSHGEILTDSRVDTVITELEKNKKSVLEHDNSIRELRATILTLQSLVITTTQTIEKLKSDIDSIKTEMVTKEMAKTTIGEDKLQSVSEGDESE